MRRNFIALLSGKKAEFFRFLIVGASVTILSLLLAYIFLQVLSTPLIPTYILLYMLTIYISYLLNKSFTFKADGSTGKALKFYLVYLTTLGIGTLVLRYMRSHLAFENWVLFCLVVPLTTVMNYVLSKLIFKKGT